MKPWVFLACCLLIVAAQTEPLSAHIEFKEALQDKYGFKMVSCYACHTRKKDVPEDKLEDYKKNTKAFRNPFGQVLAKELEGKDVSKRLLAVKDLDPANEKRVKVVDEVTKEFLESLKKVEPLKLPEGPTYGELLKEGKLDGVSLEADEEE